MNYREFGRTGMKVSVLGFGAAPLGNVYGHVSNREARRVVRSAIDLGINFFDTAPAYGNGLSETRLGSALSGFRQRVVLAGKAGRFQDGGRIEFDFSGARLRQSLEQSLIRLKTDYLDLFQVHDVQSDRLSQILDEALPELHAMKREGKIRAVGITGFSPELLAKLAIEGHPDVILSYSHYTLLNTTLNDMLAPVCSRNQIGLVNAAPLDMGLLAPEGPRPWHTASPELQAAVRQARRFCSDRGTSLESAALQYSLANADVASTLVGMRTVKEVEQNVLILDMPADTCFLAELRRLLQSPDEGH